MIDYENITNSIINKNYKEERTRIKTETLEKNKISKFLRSNTKKSKIYLSKIYNMPTKDFYTFVFGLGPQTYGPLVQKMLGHKLNATKIKAGYMALSVRGGVDRIVKQTMVHRLVCDAFYPNEKSGILEVNHKDYNKANNHKKNLEWMSRLQNTMHGSRRRCYKNERVVAVKRIDKNGREKIYNSMSEASSENKLSRGNIWAVCQNKRKTCGNYKWEYIK